LREQGLFRPPHRQDLQRLVQELQVHQIELEMQNEELLNARAEVEAGLKRYRTSTTLPRQVTSPSAATGRSTR
jgi:hypothetical protein